MKKYIPSLILLSVIVLSSGCQAVFTQSPFAGLQRDPSNLSPEQKIGYAESLLATGDTEAMADAYEEIAKLLEDDPDDPELNLLAAELAMGASGVNDVIEEAISAGDNFDVNTALENLDMDAIDSVADHVDVVLANGGEVSDNTLVTAAATTVLSVVENGGDLSALESWDGTSTPEFGNDANAEALEDAAGYILAMNNQDTGITDILSGYFGG